MSMAIDLDIVHRLAAAVRPIDHFTRETIEGELLLQLGPYRPLPGRSGDGCYRFVDLDAAILPLAIRDPRTEYVRPIPVTIPVPRAIREPLEVELWPTPRKDYAAGLTVLRVQVTPRRGLQVHIAPLGRPFDRVAFPDASGELLFVLTGPSDPVNGFVPLQAEVLDEAFAPVAIAQVDVTGITGFRVKPGTQARVRMTLV